MVLGIRVTNTFLGSYCFTGSRLATLSVQFRTPRLPLSISWHCLPLTYICVNDLRCSIFSQTHNTMLFCPTCANILLVGQDEGNGNEWACSTCPYHFPIAKQMTSRTKLKRKEVDDVMGGEDSWKNVDSTDGESAFTQIGRSFQLT